MSEYDVGDVLLGRSQIRRRILGLIMETPERRMYLREIARAVGTSAGTAARELARLEDAGLLHRVREGNQVYFETRPNQRLFGAIQEIVRHTTGVPYALRRHLAGLAGIERAVIYGSYARGTMKPDSDVDVLIIGTPDRDDLTDRLELAGFDIGRPVNEVVMTHAELESRRARADRFVESIDTGPTIDLSSAP